MRIISIIDDQQVVKKIPMHLSLWDVKRKPPPRAVDQSLCNPVFIPGRFFGLAPLSTTK
jgi:hypothetical protein